MAISWTALQFERVSAVLEQYPAEDDRCETAANEILPVAREVDATAQRRRLVPKPEAGWFLAPKRGFQWFEHVVVHAQVHVVDVLSGAAGTPLDAYLEEHFKYPDLLEWEPMDEPGLQ
jgi:hypothetical protein